MSAIGQHFESYGAGALAKLRRITLYEVALSLLVFTDGISRLAIWDAGGWLDALVNVFQLGVYVLLALLVVKNYFSIGTYICIALSAAVFMVGYLMTKDAVFVRDLLLMIAAKDVPFNRTLKSMRRVLCLVVVLGLLSVTMGFVDMEEQRRGGLALGFSHPNQTALVFTIIVFLWLAERRSNFAQTDLLVAIGATALIYLVTKCRTTLTLSIVVVLVGYLVMRNPGVKPRPIIGKIAIAMPICCLLFTVVTALLLPTNNIANQIDLFLSNRVFLNWYAFEHHGVTLFGQVVNLTEGSGTAYNEIRGIWNSLITVDNSYTLSLVSLGVVPTLFFVGWLTFAQKKIADSGDTFLLFLGIAFCVYGITEAQMIDAFNNFTLLAVYALASSKPVLRKGIAADAFRGHDEKE